MRMSAIAILISVLAASGCSDKPLPSAPVPNELTVDPVASGLSSPVSLTAPPGDARQFIVEQTGRIRIIKNDVLLPTPYLDVSSKITTGGERGLLGLAF